MCRLLGVSTSGYYAWRVRSPSRRAQQNKELSRRIAAIHAESRQTYGARRVWAELRAQGVTVSRRRVARLMRALGLQGGDAAEAALHDPQGPASDRGAGPGPAPFRGLGAETACG